MPYEPLKLTPAAQIFYSTYPKPPSPVEGILPAGLTVLSGDSKIGKSWLVLWLALQISQGLPVWGIPTEKQDVVYLALEDNDQRLQKRMHRLVDVPPPNLYISYSGGCIGEELEEQLKGILWQYPDTGLIIIDTLQKVREDQPGANAYAKDYKDLSALKAIADEKNISILLVHHTRKLRSKADIYDDSSGSKAIMAVPDTKMILRKDERMSQNATLSITGRDVEDKQLRLKKRDVVWELIETLDAEALRRKQIPEWIFRVAEMVLTEKSFIGNTTALLDKLGISGLHPTKASKQLSAYGGEVFEPLGIEMVRNITSLSRDLMLRLKPLPDNRFTRQFRDADDANDASDDIVRQRILARLKGEKQTKQAPEEGQEEGWPNTTAPVAQTASAASSASDGYTGGENP